MFQLSNAFSDAVLATVCIAVFFRFFARIPFYNRILWGIFLVTTALAAAAGTFRFLGFQDITDTHRSLTVLAGSVGLACAVVAVWGTVMHQSMTRMAVILTTSLGLVLFVFLLYPTFQVFGAVAQSFTMLLVVLIGVFGLMKKNQRAIWVIIGVMIIGLATKVATHHLPLNPTDTYHYALAVMIYCFGRVV